MKEENSKLGAITRLKRAIHANLNWELRGNVLDLTDSDRAEQVSTERLCEGPMLAVCG